MKKQILFLTFFVAAILAGINSYAQNTGDGLPAVYEDYPSSAALATDISCAVVTPLACVGGIDELHPQAGQPYTYSVTTDATNTVHWFVVVDEDNIAVALNDITGVTGANIDDDGLGGDNWILASDAAYNNQATTSSSVSITWKSFDGLIEQVLLVAYVEDGAGCTDNIEVYRILPFFNFTLDVNAIASTGVETGVAGSATAEECVSPIETATYTASATPLTVPGELVVDYGENWVYFTVTAANFTHSWQPSFLITYSGTQSEAIDADWAYPTDAIANTNWNNIGDLTGATPAAEVLHSGTVIGTSVGSDDGTGECIVVRVQVDHGVLPENAVNNQNIQLAVNGFMYDQVGASYTNADNEDLHFADTNADTFCNDTDGFTNDVVDYVLTPRPQIISATNAATGTLQLFETKEDNLDRTGAN